MATAIQRASAASRGGSSADEMAIEDRKCAFCMKDHNDGIEVLCSTLDKSINNRAIIVFVADCSQQLDMEYTSIDPQY